jgi:hypothetical protein
MGMCQRELIEEEILPQPKMNWIFSHFLHFACVYVRAYLGYGKSKGYLKHYIKITKKVI